MTVNTAAGAKLYIGGVADESVVAANQFEDLSLVEVGEIEDLGEFGDVVSLAVFTALNDSRTRKKKTSYDAGDFNITIGFDSADTGQDALKAALATKFDYGFKVTLNDGSDGSPSDPTTFYFRALVTSFKIMVGTVDNIVKASVGIAINSAIVQNDAV